MRPSASVRITPSPIEASVTWARSFSSVEGLLGVLALGDVDRDADAAGDLPLLAAQRLDAGLEGAPLPDVLEAHRLAAEGELVGADGRASGSRVP